MKNKYFYITLLLLLTLPLVLHANVITTTANINVFALFESSLDKFEHFISIGDKLANRKLFEKGLLVMLKEGVKVEVIDVKPEKKRLKVRVFGTLVELWTYTISINDYDRVIKEYSDGGY